MTIIITNKYYLDQLFRNLKTISEKANLDIQKILKFLTVADNKDKLLKILQYAVKLIIVTSTRDLKPPSSQEVDLKSCASTISLARKIGRLGNWLPGVQDVVELCSSKPDSVDSDYGMKLVSSVASVGNDLLDDWICLQKARLFFKTGYLDKLDLWSTRLWFISVSIDLKFTLQKLTALNKSSSKPESDDFKRKRMDLYLTAGKQFCDWAFCIWELANLDRFSDKVPVIAGLSAACIGAIRGYRKLK